MPILSFQWILIGTLIGLIAPACKARNAKKSEQQSTPQNQEICDPESEPHGHGAADYAKQQSMGALSSSTFAKRGYTAFHSCQDASRTYVRIANREDIESLRLDIYCNELSHAIVMVRVIDQNKKFWWCPQEPQDPPKAGKYSNVDDLLCVIPNQPMPQDYADRICKAFRAGKGIQIVLHKAGDNQPGTISNPVMACSESKAIASAEDCTACCEKTWQGTDRDFAENIQDWQDRCNLACNNRFQ